MSKGGLSRGIFGAHPSAPSGAPGQVTDLTTPTASSTSFTAEFSVPAGTITGYQARIDGGTPFTISGPGAEITDQVTGLAVDVEVRAMNGGTPGAWSTVSVGDPGLDVRITFDDDAANLDGNSNGSWKANATNVFTSTGNINCGFASAQDCTDATTTIRNTVADFRKLVDSIGRVNLIFGMGRYKSQHSASWFALNSGTGGAAGWSSDITSLANYAAYQSKIGALTNATQKALWPAGGTVTDPGGYGITSAATAIDDNLNAIWTNNTSNTSSTFMVYNSGYNWDCTTDETSCAALHLKLSFTSWHELVQPLGIYKDLLGDGVSRISIMMMVAYSAAGTNWNGTNGTQYYSHDGGTTNLGNITATPSEDIGAEAGAEKNAFAYWNPGYGNTGIPGLNGNPGTAIQLSGGGRQLPFRLQQDAKLLCAMVPPTAELKTMAGL